MSEGFDLVIKLNVNDRGGEPGSLICFEHEGKRWCAYYIEPWEFMEKELRGGWAFPTTSSSSSTASS